MGAEVVPPETAGRAPPHDEMGPAVDDRDEPRLAQAPPPGGGTPHVEKPPLSGRRGRRPRRRRLSPRRRLLGPRRGRQPLARPLLGPFSLGPQVLGRGATLPDAGMPPRRHGRRRLPGPPRPSEGTCLLVPPRRHGLPVTPGRPPFAHPAQTPPAPGRPSVPPGRPRVRGRRGRRRRLVTGPHVVVAPRDAAPVGQPLVVVGRPAPGRDRQTFAAGRGASGAVMRPASRMAVGRGPLRPPAVVPPRPGRGDGRHTLGRFPPLLYWSQN